MLPIKKPEKQKVKALDLNEGTNLFAPPGQKQVSMTEAIVERTGGKPNPFSDLSKKK